MSGTTFDEAKAEQFAESLLGAFNGAATTLLISVGYRAGLLDAIAGLPPSTSEEIARAAGCNERYVREWANGMTAAKIVAFDPKSKRYSLPAEHAMFLTHEAGLNNLAHMTQYVPLMARVEDDLLDKIRNGGGLTYDHYPNFQQLQGEEAGPVFEATLEPVVLGFAPGLTERLEAGIDVLEVGCGVGHPTILLAQRFPNSRFVGTDLSDDGIARAQKRVADLGLTNARFELADAATVEGSYDLVMAFDMVHDSAKPAQIMENTRRILRDGGVFLIGDVNASSNPEDNVAHPIGTALYMFSVFHCMTVSLAQDGAGLGTVWGRQLATKMLTEAGFSSVSSHEVEGDFFHIYYVATK